MKGLIAILLSFLVIAQVPASGLKIQEAEEQMALANEAFEAGQPESAILAYEQLIDNGYRSVSLHYNLGNGYFKSGQLAKAILNYERALLIDRYEDDVLFNLSIAREMAEDEIQPLPPFFLVSWWRLIRDGLSSGLWALLAILILWAAAAGMIVWMFSPKREMKKLGFVAGVLLLGISLVPIIMGAQRVQTEQKSNFAIVLSPEIPLRIASSEDSQQLLKLHEGTKVEILDSIGTNCNAGSACWFKVRLANGELGWLPYGEIERI